MKTIRFSPQSKKWMWLSGGYRCRFVIDGTRYHSVNGYVREHRHAEGLRDALIAKFTQNPALKEKLLETGDAKLVLQGSKKNHLGQELMTLRSWLQQEEPSDAPTDERVRVVLDGTTASGPPFGSLYPIDEFLHEICDVFKECEGRTDAAVVLKRDDWEVTLHPRHAMLVNGKKLKARLEGRFPLGEAKVELMG
jgi:hypothetical protein